VTGAQTTWAITIAGHHIVAGQLKSLDDRSYTIGGPRPWSNLPLHLSNSQLTLVEFCRLLRTHFFG